MSARLPVRESTRSSAARAWTGFLIIFLHVAALGAMVSGRADRTDWLLFAVIFPLQFVGVAICLHRYFAHHAFHTSRAFQFVLALCAASSFGDPIRFAGKHRLHHQHADRQDDPHTPLHGFWSSWFGSHIDSGYTDDAVCAEVPWLTRYPELRWLHRHSLIPGLALCAIAFLVGGFSGVAIGVLLGAVIVLHESSAVNFICHKYGYRNFDTPDQSTNHVFIAVFTCGEGWHNNHHRFPTSARHGFRRWEIDMFYWVICGLEALGLIWNVRRPPAALLKGDFPKAA